MKLLIMCLLLMGFNCYADVSTAKILQQTDFEYNICNGNYRYITNDGIIYYLNGQEATKEAYDEWLLAHTVVEKDKNTGEVKCEYTCYNLDEVIKAEGRDVYIGGVLKKFFDPRNVLNRLNSEIFPMALDAAEQQQMLLMFPLVDTAMRYDDAVAYQALMPVLSSLRQEVGQKVVNILIEEGANIN